ncbi:CsiV family protein [Alteromonas sp. C1M14]|uniref:CsiV family protein n=1 Tax=Alteromonas sp. C1M14 TaxID=2841567 RepID=UPI001C09C27A|nr:CsiV family protein [Alteromonas sp. C1M14]MBU2978957.1 peptidoglycan binding protein CsiV [Alteromonas sp. C1M14]
MKPFTVAAYFLLLLTSTNGYAADDWWFDIEVIIFDRSLSIDELDEKFDGQGSLAPTSAEIDLIDNYLRPDISGLKQGLAQCDGSSSPLWLPMPSIKDILSTHKKWQVEQGLYSSDTDNQNTQDMADGTQSSSYEPKAARLSLSQSQGQYTQTEPAISSQTIASYWVAFSGIENFTPISVPKFRTCETPEPWLTYQQGKWQTHFPDNGLPAPDHVPEFLEGRDLPRSPVAHLLPYDKLELTDLSRQIRQTRGLKRLLHVAWRQPVKFGQQTAEAMRIIAGKNYASEYDLSGQPITKDEKNTENSTDDNPLSLGKNDFFSQLDQALTNPNDIAFNDMLAVNQPAPMMLLDSVAGASEGENLAIWQLDGYLKVYLKYINRVPYLHIDSEMQYRQPTLVQTETSDELTPPSLQLTSVPFHQVRRVISKQVHYFDHPLFGMVVEIRRYKRPQGE